MWIKALEAAVLIRYVVEGSKNPVIGFDDADRTLEELRKELNKPIWVEKTIVESALYSSVLHNELGKWEHPDALSLQAFIKRMTPRGYVFDKDSNTWEKK